MREIKTTVYCDRCGKKITDAEYSYAIDIFSAAENCTEGDPKDLCLECTKSFRDWMEEGLKYHYQVKYYSADKDEAYIKQTFKTKDEALIYIKDNYPNYIYENDNDAWRLNPGNKDGDFLYIYKRRVSHES